MGKVTDIEASRLERALAAAAADAGDRCQLSSYELGFIEALLSKQGVPWGAATAEQFEEALRELDTYTRTERGDVLPE